ncbi:MAG: hypothetical protein IPL61_03845 [Myxococcales bacterium]|nr:hypothetical protein [Myxococcales bacterium]
MRRARLTVGLFAAGLVGAACGPTAVTPDARPIDARIDGAPLIDAPAADAAGPDAGALPDALVADAGGPDAACPTQAFVMDGALDASATVIAGGVTSVRLAVAYSADGTLYVATDDAGEGSDHFVLVSATPPGPGTGGAPFAKAGLVAVGAGPLLFLADENDNDFESWFRLEAVGADTQLTGAGYAAATGANGGVLEGAIDLAAAFGAVPTTIYLAAVPYATADGGALVAAAQTPSGDGDGDVGPAEFVAYTIPCP